MLIGIRILVVAAAIAIAITLLGYLFTRNPKFLAYSKLIAKVTLAVGGLIALIYIAERLLIAL
jgi:uncharacterized protein involved in exopolysaccharide biosynthesis